MEARVQELEEQVSELTDEVRILRGELRRLRRRLEGEGGSRDGRSSVTARSEASEIEASEGYSFVSRVASSQRGLASPSPSIAPSAQSPGSSAGRSSRPCVLTWAQREAICDQIATFVVRALAGELHGSSGRDQINLPSRVWLVFQDYEGINYNPVKVYRVFGRCSHLVKRGPNDLGQSIFIGLPSDREARRVVGLAGLEWPAQES